MKQKRVFGVLAYAVVALFMLMFMVKYSNASEFWYDEVYQLGMVRDGVSVWEMLSEYAQLKDYTPPLYALICYVWVRIVPFSFRWLLLPSEGFVSLGVFVTALAGARIGGRWLGLLAELFAAASSVLVLAAGYEFRSYGLYFFAVSLVIYCLARRLQSPGWRWEVLYALSLVLLLCSHYYGGVVALVLFFIEFVFVLGRRVRWSGLAPYIAAGAVFAPWMALVLLNRTRSMTEFWIEPPNLMSLIGLAQYLCGENAFVLGILLFGSAVIAVGLLKKAQSRAFDIVSDGVWVFVGGMPVGVVALMYVYGAYINPAGGLFYNRYFLGLLPCCFLIMAVGIKWLGELWAEGDRRRTEPLAVMSLAVCLIVGSAGAERVTTRVNKKPSLSYTGSVQTMADCGDIEASDVAVVTTDNPWVSAGIKKYFREFHGVRPNVISQYEDGFAERVKQYRKVYLFRGKQTLTAETESALSGYVRERKRKGKRVEIYERG